MIQFVFADSISVDDQKYFTEVYLRYEPIMYSTARKYIDNINSIEDIVQDSVEKLIDKIGTLKKLNHHSLSTYIVYTVKNTAMNHLRRANIELKHFISEQDSVMELFSDNRYNTPESILLSAEFTNETWELLGKLPETQLALLKYKYILGLDDYELAKIIGCKPGSVRMYLTRARRNAMAILDKGGAI